MKEEKFLETATTLALTAAEVVMDLRLRPIHSSRKDDRSLVTEADLRSDRILSDGLRENFPDHAILSEESGLSGPAGSDWVWVIDPLDGTKAYARGISGFSVMVGLLKEGSPCLGVVVDPLDGLVYQAIRGLGTTCQNGGKKTLLRVSNRADFSKMPIALSADLPPETLQRIAAELPSPVVAINSVGIKIGLLVRQQADIYFSHHSIHYWDSCAPQVILEEAGGIFTRSDGRPLVYDLKREPTHEMSVVASNGTRHSELIQLFLKKTL